MTTLCAFDDAALLDWLEQAEPDLIDDLPFGVIGFDPLDDQVRLYNATESRAAGISPQRVLGQHLFLIVAPCLNNDLVADRFHAAARAHGQLDERLDYVLTLRMRPTAVRLRLLAQPHGTMSYVLVDRRAAA